MRTHRHTNTAHQRGCLFRAVLYIAPPLAPSRWPRWKKEKRSSVDAFTSLVRSTPDRQRSSMHSLGKELSQISSTDVGLSLEAARQSGGCANGVERKAIHPLRHHHYIVSQLARCSYRTTSLDALFAAERAATGLEAAAMWYMSNRYGLDSIIYIAIHQRGSSEGYNYIGELEKSLSSE